MLLTWTKWSITNKREIVDTHVKTKKKSVCFLTTLRMRQQVESFFDKIQVFFLTIMW